MGIPVQLSGRFGPGTGYAPSQARRVQTSDHQSSGERHWTAPTGMAKTPERRAGQVHLCNNPLGHRASGLERQASALALTFALSVRDWTIPCERRVKDSTQRRGTLMCEEGLKYEAPVMGAAVTEKEQ